MKKLILFLTFFIISTFSINSFALKTQWSYDGKHGAGPDEWHKVHPIAKDGTRQSPIDIEDYTKADLVDVVVKHKNVNRYSVEDNGHTIKVNYKNGSYMELDGHRYELLQFHFHAPSEHLLNGKKFPMELHFVHADEAGRLAVIGVFLTEGKSNKALQAIWDNIGKKVDGKTLNIQSLMTSTNKFYRYNGSLTTPPASEGVAWTVLDTPLEVSKAQISAFTKMYANNARPIQPKNNRFVLANEN